MFGLPCVILNFFVFPVRASKRCVLAILRPPSPSVQHADDCAVRAAASRFAHFACSMQPPPPRLRSARCSKKVRAFRMFIALMPLPPPPPFSMLMTTPRALQRKGSRISHSHCADAAAAAAYISFLAFFSF